MNLEEHFMAESTGRKEIKLIPSLEKVLAISKCSIKRGDGILIDVMEEGKKTGKKEFVVVAGFTYHPEGNPSVIIWYGDPEDIVREKKFLVVGRFFTEELQKEIIKIEMPKYNPG